MNERLISTLLNISRVSRKTINVLLKVAKPTGLTPKDIQEMFVNGRRINKKIPIPTLENIELAINKSEETLKNSHENNIQCITILDEDFPSKLKNIDDPPVLLFYKGNKECIFENKAIAIIGSRIATIHGLKIAERLGCVFGKEGFTVVSGLAKGCDELAHRGCVNVKGKSIAVLPAGLDNIYPNSNERLANEIIENGGCLISEYPIGTKPFKNFFVERDRLQSALSKVILVVETNIDGGTMHTAQYALNQNKILACYNNHDFYSNSEAADGNIKLIIEDKALEIKNEVDIEMLKKKIYEDKEFVNESIEIIPMQTKLF